MISIIAMRPLAVFAKFLVLFCLGLGLAQAASAEDAQGLKFTFAQDTASRFAEITTQGHLSIYVTGDFIEGDAERFAAFVRRNEVEMANIVFDSPGGSLFEGVKLGRIIRSLGFNTDVGHAPDEPGHDGKAICASACAYAFAGGDLRSMSTGSLLGLHQFRSEFGAGANESDVQTISAILVSYLAEMGVDANAFAIASATRPDEMIWLTYDDANKVGFVSSGFFSTTAEVKLADMRPYLRLNQRQPSADLRVLLICWDRRISVQAGIVTDPEQSANIVEPGWAKRSYLELDYAAILPMPGVSGVEAKESTVWLARDLSAAQASALSKAESLGIWLDGHGIVRFGGAMNIADVRPAITDYVRQCFAS